MIRGRVSQSEPLASGESALIQRTKQAEQATSTVALTPITLPRVRETQTPVCDYIITHININQWDSSHSVVVVVVVGVTSLASVGGRQYLRVAGRGGGTW